MKSNFIKNLLQFITISGSFLAIFSLFFSVTLLKIFIVIALVLWLSWLNRKWLSKIIKNILTYCKTILHKSRDGIKKKVLMYVLGSIIFVTLFIIILNKITSYEENINNNNDYNLSMNELQFYKPIAKCKENKFISNLQELKNYIIASKKFPILNPDKLINLLNIYFESMLLYKSNSPKKFLIVLEGKTYATKFEGHDSKGKKKRVDLNDIANTLIKEISVKIIENHQIEKNKLMFDIYTQVYATDELEDELKINILNLEQNEFKNEFTQSILNLPEKKAIESIKLRRSFTYKKIIRPNSLLQDSNYAEINAENLYKLYESYTDKIIDIYIINNKYVDIFKFLLEDLKIYSEKRFLVQNLTNLIKWNNLFLFEKKENIEEILIKYEKGIEDSAMNILREGLKFTPANIDLINLSIGLQDYNFGNVNFKNVRTIVSFVIPYETNIEYKVFSKGKNKIEFVRIHNLFDDPIFRFLKSINLSMNLMPLTILSDAIGQIPSSTLINIVIEDFYHPDFEIINDSLKFKDFTDKEALLGRKYYPHKDTVINILREIRESTKEDFPIEISQNDININLISNYFVNYIENDNKSIYHKLYTITNLDSYLSIKKRYLNQISKLNLDDDYTKIKELLYDTDIVNSNVFREFLTKLIDLVVKKSIEKREIYKFLWESNVYDIPKSEREIQPIIKSHLQPILEIKGIQISREIVAANGSLDYHCSYNIDNNLNKVCIELKLAHNEKLLDGISKQLPAYMEDEGTRDGLFIVLWFKNENFEEPPKYKNKDQLLIDLQNSIPENLRIDVILIDCSQPTVPSKL